MGFSIGFSLGFSIGFSILSMENRCECADTNAAFQRSSSATGPVASSASSPGGPPGAQGWTAALQVVDLGCRHDISVG